MIWLSVLDKFLKSVFFFYDDDDGDDGDENGDGGVGDVLSGPRQHLATVDYERNVSDTDIVAALRHG